MGIETREPDRESSVLLAWMAAERLFSADLVPKVLEAMAQLGIPMEEAVVGLAGVSDEEIARRYATHFHVPMTTAGQAPDPAGNLARVLPEAFCREHLMVPLSRTRTGLLVALVNPSRIWLHAQITLVTGLELKLRVAPLSRVMGWIEDLHATRQDGGL